MPMAGPATGLDDSNIMAAVEAGCERISGTPLPFAYSLFLRRTAHIVCMLLPLALVTSTGWATPVFTELIVYTYFGLDALSEELEEPFGTEANDLALDGLCRVCEISCSRRSARRHRRRLPANATSIREIRLTSAAG